MTFTAVILAAGSSTRAGFDKTLAMLAGKPVWRWSYDQYRANPQIETTVVVASDSNIKPITEQGAHTIKGGETRQQSVLNALQAVTTDAVLLHDAARPLISQELINSVIAAVEQTGAAAAGIPVVDTIKLRTGNHLETLDRSSLVAMQTPQAARTELLKQAHAQATADATDDMALLEAIGVQPTIVSGDPHNFKITTAEDLARARAIVGHAETRIGFGYDVHPFSQDQTRTLMLGGIAFPNHHALDGHSDADVLLHAVTDAVLGAAGLGDIGRHFPNTDNRWKGEPSLTFLRAAARLLKDQGWEIVNVDVTVVAESPKITPRADEMIAQIAQALQIAPNRVSIKATTNERMGFVGRGEGIAATAVASIRRSE
jgi:2-C-methyl-D-erythritol 4-phosphate cytidylyltransferase/2-C-methyl-D-erythritol 2,4-cyclodiphosphate synthase